MNSLKLVFVLQLMFSLSAHAQLQSVQVFPISKDELRERILKIPNTEEGNRQIANLLLERPQVLGGKCLVATRPKGKYLYTLKIPKMKTPIRVNEKAGVKTGKKPKTKWVYPERSEEEIAKAKLTLAKKFRDVIGRRGSWPCGDVDISATATDLTKLAEEIEFVVDVDDQGNETMVCLYKENKTVKIRDPETCSTKEFPVMDELDKGLCEILVRRSRRQLESYLHASTRTKKPEKLPDLNIPPLKKMTSETKKELKRYKKIKEVLPEIMSIVDGANTPEADDFFDPDTIELLHKLGYEGGEDENGIMVEADFDDLSEEMQEKVYLVALTLDEIEGKQQYVQPSEDLIDLLIPVREAAREWKKDQKEEELQLVDIPLASELEERFIRDSDTLKEIYGPNLKKLQQCKPPKKKPIATKPRIKFKKKK